MNHFVRAGLGFVCVVVAACGGDDDGGGSNGGDLAQFEGIYTITSHTENTMGCDAPGDSIIDEADPMLAGVAISFFFQPALTLHTCLDLADCRVVAEDAKTNNTIPFFGGYVFETASGNVATGRTTIAGTDFDTGQCYGQLITHTLTVADDGSITLQSRTINTPNFAPAGSGECRTEDAEAAAAGQPCSEQITIEADLTEPL